MRIIPLRVVILALLAPAAACHWHRSKPQPPVAVITSAPAPAPAAITAPPPMPAIDAALAEAGRGDYAPAALALEQYLRAVPAGLDRDRALYHLGLIYALPGNLQQDWTRAAAFWAQLVAEFPSSSLKPAAELLLSLREETVRLAAEAAVRDERIRELSAEGDQRDQRIRELNAETERRDQRIRELNTETERRDQRIRELNRELERLIQIDSERRPRP